MWHGLKDSMPLPQGSTGAFGSFGRRETLGFHWGWSHVGSEPSTSSARCSLAFSMAVSQWWKQKFFWNMRTLPTEARLLHPIYRPDTLVTGAFQSFPVFFINLFTLGSVGYSQWAIVGYSIWNGPEDELMLSSLADRWRCATCLLFWGFQLQLAGRSAVVRSEDGLQPLVALVAYCFKKDEAYCFEGLLL